MTNDRKADKNVILHVLRYHAPEEVDCESVEMAVRVGHSMLEHNTAWADRIEVDGKVVMDRDQIEARWKELGLE